MNRKYAKMVMGNQVRYERMASIARVEDFDFDLVCESHEFYLGSDNSSIAIFSNFLNTIVLCSFIAQRPCYFL